MSRIGATALAAAIVLSLPAAALGQSAGDEQYRDPFAGQDEPQDDGPAGQDDPAPAPAPAPAPTTTVAPTESTATTTAEPVATTAGTLPRTGSAAAWVAGFGLLLIAAGAGLRRTART